MQEYLFVLTIVQDRVVDSVLCVTYLLTLPETDHCELSDQRLGCLFILSRLGVGF